MDMEMDSRLWIMGRRDVEAAASSHGHRLTVSPGRQDAEEVRSRSRQHHRSFIPPFRSPSQAFSSFFFLAFGSVSRA